VHCAKCGADNREGRKFRAKCTAPLARLCPRAALRMSPEGTSVANARPRTARADIYGWFIGGFNTDLKEAKALRCELKG
jgi:hypothetical protein